MKWLNRLRRRLADSIWPKKPWSFETHTAYPETQIQDDGSWVVRFYAYEPFAWIFAGETYREKPTFPGPDLPHPTKFPHGKAPADVVAAWQAYYEKAPKPVTLLKEIEGKASGRLAAQTLARQTMLRELRNYRRVV